MTTEVKKKFEFGDFGLEFDHPVTFEGISKSGYNE